MAPSITQIGHGSQLHNLALSILLDVIKCMCTLPKREGHLRISRIIFCISMLLASKRRATFLPFRLFLHFLNAAHQTRYVNGLQNLSYPSTFSLLFLPRNVSVSLSTSCLLSSVMCAGGVGRCSGYRASTAWSRRELSSSLCV